MKVVVYSLVSLVISSIRSIPFAVAELDSPSQAPSSQFTVPHGTNFPTEVPAPHHLRGRDMQAYIPGYHYPTSEPVEIPTPGRRKKDT
mmetsp:Transcript_30621/g.31119  ORF Transcript_30621/g.31119 Transcript_30621/m.31119 type:complete len:88 (+) Transcript_30621:47-310(+)